MAVDPWDIIWDDPSTVSALGGTGGTATSSSVHTGPSAVKLRLFELQNQLRRLGIDMDDLIEVLEEM
jgi:hypothetical protein